MNVIRHSLLGLAAVIACVTIACAKRPLAKMDIIGHWQGPLNATMIFNADGSFVARALPSELLIDRDAGPVDGKGQWSIRNAPGGEQVHLGFDGLLHLKNGFGIPLLVAASDARNTLFWWKAEAGGPRFEFAKIGLEAGSTRKP